MRIAEHLLVLLLLITVAVLGLDRRDARLPTVKTDRPFEAERGRASPQLSGMAPKAAEAGEAASPASGAANQRPPERVRTEAELHAASEHARAKGGTAEDPLTSVLKTAAKHVATGDRWALYRQRLSGRRSAPNTATLRAWVRRFATETDPEILWSLTQLIRFKDHVHWGSVWMHDPEAIQGMQKQAEAAADPFKRYLALDALGQQMSKLEAILLRDDDPHVRAKAASLLPELKGRRENDVRPLPQAVRDLVRSPAPAVRELAVTGLARWAFREAEQETLVELARHDPDAGVRAAAVRSLHGRDSHRIRTALYDLMDAAGENQAVRNATRAALASLPVLPDDVWHRLHAGSQR